MRGADLPRVLAIQHECYSEIVPEDEAAFRTKLQASADTCFVACVGAEVQGYLVAVPVAFPEIPALHAAHFERPAQPDSLCLHDLAIASAGRGTGAGAALVQAALGRARAAGLARACLVSIQQSHDFWAGFGFRDGTVESGALRPKLASYGPGARLMLLDLS
jgi:GNAT superfamily N-acetyltransferase